MDNTYVLNVYNTCTGRYEEVEVTKEVYTVYKRTGWNLEYDNKRFHKFQSTQTEFEGIDGSGAFEATVDNYKLRNEEDDFEDSSKERIEFVRMAVNTLRKTDREVITALFFKDKTETEAAEELHVSRMSIHKRKVRILKKLKREILNLYADQGYILEA